jgi:hypothetical protein
LEPSVILRFGASVAFKECCKSIETWVARTLRLDSTILESQGNGGMEGLGFNIRDPEGSLATLSKDDGGSWNFLYLVAKARHLNMDIHSFSARHQL